MKSLASKGLYVGTGAGLVLFILMGFLPSSLIGGVVGLKVVGWMYGTFQATIISRLVLAVCMMAGILVSATLFTVGAGLMGWSVGGMMDAIRSKKGEVVGYSENV